MVVMTNNVPAAVLNNSAIAYLQVGRAPEAMELLQSALANLRDQFVERRDPPSPECSHREPIEQNGGDDDQPMEIQDERERCSESYKSINVFSSSPGQMRYDASLLTPFDRALLVDCASPCGNNEIISAVILFNMALLHHSRGLEYGKSDFLHRATRLYHIALTILQKLKNRKPNYLLLMALFNNMAHIDYHLSRMREMKDSLEQMRHFLNAEEDDDEDDESLEEGDYVIFFMNAMMMGEEKEATVAAAA